MFALVSSVFTQHRHIGFQRLIFVDEKMGKIKIGYWNIRAYAESIRYALEYCGEEYEDKQYPIGPAPDFDKTEWLADKWNLGLDFPNLPYLIDGENKVTETMAVLKYVCRKHGLMPRPGLDTIRADILEGVLLDYRKAFYSQFFTPDSEYENAKETFQEKSKQMLSQIDKFMGENKWLQVSNEITYPDFFLCTYLKQMLCMYPRGLDDFKRLQKYVSDFDELPGIREYLLSGRFTKYPITGPSVRWGYKEEE